jgi:hypothetical protein
MMCAITIEGSEVPAMLAFRPKLVKLASRDLVPDPDPDPDERGRASRAADHFPAARGGTTQKYTVWSPSGSLMVIVFRGFQSPMS